jgi:hypothetical protein
MLKYQKLLPIVLLEKANLWFESLAAFFAFKGLLQAPVFLLISTDHLLSHVRVADGKEDFNHN